MIEANRTTQEAGKRDAGSVLDGCLGRMEGCLTTLLVSGLFFVIGVALAAWGWTVLQNARASAEWPTAVGVITGAELDHSSDEDGDSWQPRVSYRYLAEDVQRTGVTIKFGENSYDSRRTAEEILARYPVGRPVAVYYDPADPETSVLEPGVTAGSYILLAVGSIFVVLSVIALPAMLFFGSRD